MAASALLIALLFVPITVIATSNTTTLACWPNATCGCSWSSPILTRIIGGQPAGIDTWGWIVSIRIWNNHVCCGSLISATVVITAAHCLMSIKTKSSLSITWGSKYLSRVDQRRSIADIYVHRDYEADRYVHDIALLRLSSSIDEGQHLLAFICLPPMIDGYPFGSQPVVAIGWGVVSTVEKKPSDLLQQVTLTTFANTMPNCRRMIFNGTLQLCAGAEQGGKGTTEGRRRPSLHVSVSLDTCQGDSGGPLMLFARGQWQLVGITSYGTGCARADYPGVYTRVSTYTAWITCFLERNVSCIDSVFIIKSSFSSPAACLFSPHRRSLVRLVCVSIVSALYQRNVLYR